MNIMKRNSILWYRDNPLFQSIAFYIMLTILLLPFYQYQINPDGISYIGIAKKYMLLDFSNAINGYWGPLLSLLLIPFLFFGFNPLFAMKLLSLTIGLMTIIQSNILIKVLNIEYLFRCVLLNLIAIIVIYFALTTITPDLLFVCFGLGFINSILNSSYINCKYSGAISGLIGLGLYLSKSYGFPFFLASFSVVNFFFYFRTVNKQIKSKILKNFFLGIGVFILTSAIWISLISNKYGYFTISTSGSYNHAIFGPHSLGHPMTYMRLIDPPNKTAISVWEDVSYVKIQNWSVFDSYSTLMFELKKIIKNIFQICSILNVFSFLSITLIFVASVFLLEKGKRLVSHNIFILIVFLVIMFTSYSMLFIEPRYIWLSNIIIIMIGAKLFDILFKIFSLKKISKIVLVTVFVVSFSLNPLWAIYCGCNTGKNIFNLNKIIYSLNIHGRIASTGNWQSSLFLSFYNNWYYYGDTYKPEELEMKNELENKMIDYYLVWKPYEQKIKFIERYEELTNGKIDELKIYKLK
jgi:hypothetical protein